MAKRRAIWDMFVPTPDHYKAFSWAIKKYIRIYPKPVKDTSEYKIIKEVNGRQVFISKEKYNKIECSEKIWEFYLYLYLQSKK
jgi:hypothetical protein